MDKVGVLQNGVCPVPVDADPWPACLNHTLQRWDVLALTLAPVTNGLPNLHTRNQSHTTQLSCCSLSKGLCKGLHSTPCYWWSRSNSSDCATSLYFLFRLRNLIVLSVWQHLAKRIDASGQHPVKTYPSKLCQDSESGSTIVHTCTANNDFRQYNQRAL